MGSERTAYEKALIANLTNIKYGSGNPEARNKLRMEIMENINSGTRRCLSVSDAAILLGLHENSVWRLLSNGHLKKIKLPGMARTLIDANDLNELIERSKQ